MSGLKESAKALKEEHDKKEILGNQLKESYGKLRGGNKRFVTNIPYIMSTEI